MSQRCPASNLAELLNQVASGLISGKIAKTVFSEMISTKESALAIIDAKGLAQVSDEGEISRVLDEILAANPSQLAAYLGGKDKNHRFFCWSSYEKIRGNLQSGPCKQNSQRETR